MSSPLSEWNHATDQTVCHEPMSSWEVQRESQVGRCVAVSRVSHSSSRPRETPRIRLSFYLFDRHDHVDTVRAFLSFPVSTNSQCAFCLSTDEKASQHRYVMHDLSELSEA